MKSLIAKHARTLFVFLSVILLQAFSILTHAQTKRSWNIAPAMKVRGLYKNDENPMRLQNLKVDIKIMGQVAVTTLDMTFYNNNQRTLEGEFNFPLGDGQTVSRFALDINGKMREGVVVEKEQGRKTFEAIVRRGVDPGLVEMTEGNNFRMRVFPLPAKGTRRVILAFEQELTDKGKSDLYLLPLGITEPVEKFSLHAQVIKNTVEVDKDQNELANLSFNKFNDSYVADFEQDNFTADKQIALSFPHVGGTEKVFTAEKPGDSNSSYFYITIRPTLFEEAKALPKQLTLLWDNSNSGSKRNIEKELKLLDAYIQKIGTLNIELVPFNIQTGKPQTFAITNGNWENLKSALNNMVYDGGTSLGCIDLKKFRSDEVLLFSDGITNFGNSEPGFSNKPVYTISSVAGGNSPGLTYIAQQSGGAFINLSKMTIEEALKTLATSNYHFISAQATEGNISETYPSMPCQFDKSFNLTGIMKGKSASLTLNFGFGNTVKYSKTVQINADNSTELALLEHLWAEKKVAELSLNAEKNKKEIAETGKKFSIVTPNTSLIVLDNLSDYLQYDIVPPVEMQAEYFNVKNRMAADAAKKVKDHIAYVVGLSDEQSKWWDTSYSKQAKSTNPINKRDEEIDELRSQDEISNTKGVISIADVKGNDEVRGMDIADVKANIVQVEENPQGGNNFANLKEVVVDDALQGKVSGAMAKNKASIELNAWDPQTPYLKVLQYASLGQEYSTYLKLKKEYGQTPSFYLDAADFFAKAGKRDTAVTIISNLAELELEAPQLLRVLGNKLIELKRPQEAVNVYEKVLKLKGEEPQSYRNLGLALAAKGDFRQAIQTLYEVVKKDWDGRFPGIELIVMNEINGIIAKYPNLDVTGIDKRLIKTEPVDIRLVLTWDTDNCDMDLWLTDPYGEKCYYENTLTRIGGKISADFTGGYGPEEFMIKKAVPGKYLVQANYFGTRSQKLLAPINLHLVFYTNFGKPNQKKKEVTIRLDDQKDVIDVGRFSFETTQKTANPKQN